MADNYSQFSEIFEFKTQKAAKLFCDLQEICSLCSIEEVDKDILGGEGFDEMDPDLQEYVTLWRGLTPEQQEMLLEAFEPGSFDATPEKGTPKTIWVNADEYGNLDGVGSAARVALEATGDTTTVFTLTWSATCSKPRVGEFGGGWMVIHAGGVEYGNAWDEAKRAASAIKGE